MSYSTFPFDDISPPSEITMRLVPKTRVFTSIFSGTEQTVEMPGATQWRATIKWAILTTAEARLLKAFISSLHGRAGRFYLFDYAHQSPSGLGGSPLVNGSHAPGAKQIDTAFWGVNQAGVLLPGDYFSVQNELKIITEAANSDYLGHATLHFEPALRNYLNNGSLTLIRPTVLMRLLDDEQDNFVVTNPYIRDYTVQCVESFI